MPTKKKSSKLSNSKYLIKKLLHEDAKIFWPKEMGLAKRLLGFIPEIDFWEKCSVRYRPYSLSFFFTEEGVRDIRRMKRAVDFQPLPEEEVAEIQEEKIGEDIPTQPRKAKTVTDFLKI